MEEFAKKNLIPRLMRLAMNKMDSLKQIKENQLLLQQRIDKEANDTIANEDGTEQENAKPAAPKSSKDAAPKTKNTAAAILVNEERKNKKTFRTI